MAITVSVTPTGLRSTGARASGFFWSAGHSPAKAAEAMMLAPSATPAIRRVRPNRPFVLD